MIIKLAAFTKEEEEKIRRQMHTSGVKSNSAILNYSHPATIGGSILGAFTGSELGDRLIGGNHLNEIYHTISVPSKSKILGIIPRKETLIHKMTKPAGLSAKFTKNLLRGGLGAVGAGLGAIAVNKFRSHKNNKE